VIQALFDPLALWQAQCEQPVQGQAMAAGHFLAEELPQETAHALRDFLAT
jgi:haloacetate dehalogenase